MMKNCLLILLFVSALFAHNDCPPDKTKTTKTDTHHKNKNLSKKESNQTKSKKQKEEVLEIVDRTPDLLKILNQK